MLNLLDLEIPETSEIEKAKDLFYMRPVTEMEAQIGENLQKIKRNMEEKFDQTIANMNQHLWNTVQRENKSHLLCKRVESTLNPQAIHFVPGARLHGITKELELNYVENEGPNKRKMVELADTPNKKLKCPDADYIEWLLLSSDSESYNDKIESISDNK
ncbi:hypothetical protein PCASD_20323 [Puccinia coronata f. sp. avenae]|uniref:Uncharacterized protein n=1 Tax=Puccinia coronata f. sp. avenae TaxID=200324 RepID=A0A2N5U366_9BASI|nr:hypothetical protein PCASD_20323 [Puccinia coronata f. sp. avenae]